MLHSLHQLRHLRSRRLKQHYDVAVIGSGFAGSLMAMIARRLGRSVILVERGKHPRVVIGESSTPLANLLLEELVTRYDLPRLKPFTKYGSWQQSYPQIACGLKRGFAFYHHDLSRPTRREPDRQHQLLVAASPHDGIADTHWYRADFDAALVAEAVRIGVEYYDQVVLRDARDCTQSIHVQGTRDGEPVEFSAKFLIDATGTRGFLHRVWSLHESELPGFPRTEALYSHFKGVGRLQRDGWAAHSPYPVDDAAVHHVFDGGWVWVLQFNNGATSAGVAATQEAAAELHLSEGAPAWHRLLRKIPAVEAQFAGAETTLPFTYVPRLAFRSKVLAGARWALLPSTAGFVDPLLSTGFPLALLGVSRLAELIEKDWDSSRFFPGLEAYSQQTEGELLAAARLISGLYANMNDFATFASLSLLYFAVASFSESARRLGKAHLAPSFLLHDHPSFGPASATLLQRAMHLRSQADAEQLRRKIGATIEPFNVAGLNDPARGNWYPVEAEDLLAAAHKLSANSQQIAELLNESGFWETVPDR